MEDRIIKDSSIYRDQDAFQGWHRQNLQLNIGQVSKVERIEEEDITKTVYVVDVYDSTNILPIRCVRMSKFGGVYNFEEVTYRPFNGDGDVASDGPYDIKAGDIVVVGYLAGDDREGIILGCIRHPAREEEINQLGEDGIAYISVFNGIQTTIDKDGQFKQEFLGQPTNLSKLEDAPNGQVPEPPMYDEEVGTSYYMWDKTGSYILSDNAKEKPMTMKFDKPGGIWTLDIGETNITIDKNNDSISIKNVDTTWASDTSWSLTTTDMNVEASSSINAKAANINTEGELSQKGNVKVDGNQETTGDFKNDGQALIAGGANPLIYDIVLTIGTGNLGAPVISNHVFLKTVKTKAT